ncbi:MAG TPA: DegT/DnrJ/EryC1/StrS family aminotransferase [Vicinamibacteria bacterium]|nr:DegT/DnrJ/EryC1/StrS family aminotransferase [Vicinamibacteria bacterium]
MSPEVRFNDLSIGGTAPAEEIEAAVARVLASGRFILGPEVEAFEREVAAAFECGHAIGVGNGTDSISLALLALGIGPGDEVVTSPLTAAFTALGVSRIGAKPVFADVEPDTLTLSVESAARRITPKTRALMPVHLYGNAADMAGTLALARDHGLAVVEDACQAHGGRQDGKPLGSLGLVGTFSFYPTKNLGALGDGGMVTTRDEDIAAKLKRLRNGGQSSRYRHDEIGFNSRLDEVQAAVLRVKLKHMEVKNERRRALARLYEESLQDSEVRPVAVRGGGVSARHLFVIRAPERDVLAAYLKEQGIETLIHYPIPAHLQKAYASLGQGAGSCPTAEKACGEILSLPLFPALPDEAVGRVAGAIRDFYRRF